MSAPEWLTPGARVATVTHDRDRFTSVRPGVVARVGKRDVVLDDDRRFNVNRLESRPGGTWSTASTVLVSADDPLVRRARDEIRRRNERNKAEDTCLAFAHGGINAPVAADVILALAPFTGVEDEIRALFNEAKP